jgi:hypothetical protein
MLKKISAQVKLMTITWTKLKHLILKSPWKREKSVLFCGITAAYNSLNSLESEQNFVEIYWKFGANKFSTKTEKSANKRPNLPTHLVSNNILQSCVSDGNFSIYREATHLVEIFLPPAILKLRPPIGQWMIHALMHPMSANFQQ